MTKVRKEDWSIIKGTQGWIDRANISGSGVTAGLQLGHASDLLDFHFEKHQQIPDQKKKKGFIFPTDI